VGRTSIPAERPKAVYDLNKTAAERQERWGHGSRGYTKIDLCNLYRGVKKKKKKKKKAHVHFSDSVGYVTNEMDNSTSANMQAVSAPRVEVNPEPSHWFDAVRNVNKPSRRRARLANVLPKRAHLSSNRLDAAHQS
jgi:hypothetical protein